MTIYRHSRTNDFTIIGNDCLRDEELSAEALGVLCYLRGKPHDWKVMPTELAGRFRCGRDRIDRILKELIGHGYIKKVRQRDPVTKVWRAVEFVVFDTRSEPLPENTSLAPEPLTENPPLEKPPLEKPLLAFPTLLNTDLPNTDSTQNGMTPVRSKRTRLTEAEIDLVFEDRFWPAYPKRNGARGKPEAKKKFRTIVKSGGDMEKIIDEAAKLASNWAPRVARKPLDAQFIPMAATWLNKLRWDDEQGDPSEHSSGETMFELANHFEQRVKATDNEHRSYDDITGNCPIDG